MVAVRPPLPQSPVSFSQPACPVLAAPNTPPCACLHTFLVCPAVTNRLQDMASSLELPLDLLVPLVARHEPLLLQPLQQLPPRLSFLASALQLPPRNAAELLSATAPQLLATPLVKLQSNLSQLQQVLSSRGLDAIELLQERPDLLAQSPASVEAKLEQLPRALGMSRQHVRQLVAECPQLLRRSVATLQQR
jgi:hypothetical protein